MVALEMTWLRSMREPPEPNEMALEIAVTLEL